MSETVSDQPKYKTRLRLVKANEVRGQSWITCPNCQEKHALFYKRHSATRRTLHFYCDKVERHKVETKAGTMDDVRLSTLTGQVEFIDGLPIREEWTSKCKQDFQEKHIGELPI